MDDSIEQAIIETLVDMWPLDNPVGKSASIALLSGRPLLVRFGAERLREALDRMAAADLLEVEPGGYAVKLTQKGFDQHSSRKALIRNKDGQPVVYAGENGPDLVMVRIGPDGTHSILNRGDWEASPPWDGPKPSWWQPG